MKLLSYEAMKTEVISIEEYRLLQLHHEKNILLGNTQAGLHFEYTPAVKEKNSLSLWIPVVCRPCSHSREWQRNCITSISA